MSLVPAHPRHLSLDDFARATDLHPELVRRLLTLGLLDAEQDDTGTLWFHESQIREAARIERLRCWLGLTYSSIGVVVDLLDRIDELESTVRRLETRSGTRIISGGVTWTRRD